MSWIAVGAAAVGTVTAVAKGGMKKKLGNEQMRRSEQLRKDAALVKKPELREEFRNVQRLKNLNTLNGMPGYAQYQDEINQGAANQLRAGMDAAGSGTDLLAYATATQAGANDMQRKLKMDDSGYRAGALQDYAQTEWAVGNEELKNIDIQRQERNKILGQSAALENAATANKYQGTDEIIGGIGTGVSQGLASYASYRDSAEGQMKQQARLLDKQASGKELTTYQKLKLGSYGEEKNSDSGDGKKWYDYALENKKDTTQAPAIPDEAAQSLPPEIQAAIKEIMEMDGISYEEAYREYLKRNRR